LPGGVDVGRLGRFLAVHRLDENIAMEYFFSCPYCWEEISMVLDTSVRSQSYVEDCEVCCHPIEVRYSIEDGEVGDFEALALE
jgi:hypothetical protein